MSVLLTQFSAMAALCRTSDLTPSLTLEQRRQKRRLRERLQMTEALGILFFNSGVFRGCLVDYYWKVVDNERAAVRGSRHSGYCLQRYGEVYSEITDESTRNGIFKGHVDFYTANARNLSFSLKVTEFFGLQNSEIVSQNAGYKPSNA